MCNPALLAASPSAISGASSIMGFLGQNAASAANTKAANLGYANTENQIGEQGAQVDAQQSQNTVQEAIDRISAQGRISASASSYGANAASATRAANAADFGAGRALSIENVNSANQRINLGQESTNAWYARQSQENQVLPGSPLTLALGLAKAGAAGLSAYSSYGGTGLGFGGGGAISPNSDMFGAAQPTLTGIAPGPIIASPPPDPVPMGAPTILTPFSPGPTIQYTPIE